MIKWIHKLWLAWLNDDTCPVCGYYCLNKYAGCRPPAEYYEVMAEIEDNRGNK